jgi:polyphosphate kinase
VDPSLRARLIADLDVYLADNMQAWELEADGHYVQLSPAADEEPRCAQLVLLRQLAEAS